MRNSCGTEQSAEHAGLLLLGRYLDLVFMRWARKKYKRLGRSQVLCPPVTQVCHFVGRFSFLG